MTKSSEHAKRAMMDLDADGAFDDCTSLDAITARIDAAIDAACVERSAEIKRAEEELSQLRHDLMMSNDCLGMIAGALASYPCRHGTGKPHDTPPMMFPEWIACIVAKTREDQAAEIARLQTQIAELRAALAALATEHDTPPGFRYCQCPAHRTARTLLATQPKEAP